MNDQRARRRREARLADEAARVAATASPVRERVPLPDDVTADPWLCDTSWLLRELERVRGLVLQIPVTAATHGATQTATDALWTLEDAVRQLWAIHGERQRAFQRRMQAEGAKFQVVEERSSRSKQGQSYAAGA